MDISGQPANSNKYPETESGDQYQTPARVPSIWAPHLRQEVLHGREELDRQEVVQVGVPGSADDTHAAVADLIEDLVVGNSDATAVR